MVPRALTASVPVVHAGRATLSPHRVMRHLWRAYCYALATSPLATQSLTAAVGFASGDACAQMFSGERQAAKCRQRDGRLSRVYRKLLRLPEEPEWRYDWQRTLRLAAFGGAVAGPLGHTWFRALDRHIMPGSPRSAPAVVLKCMVDQALMAPFGCALFYAVERTLAGKPHTVVDSLQTKFAPTMLASYRLWPAAHIVNFALVPPAYRVLYTNLVSVVWTFILSKTAAEKPMIVAAGPEIVPLCEGAEWEQSDSEHTPDVHIRPAFV